MRTTQTKFLSWGNWGKVDRVGRYFLYFKNYAYQPCSKEGKLGGGVGVLDQRPGTIKPENRDLQRVSVGKCCAYMIVFSNWWVVRGFQSQDINVVTFCLKTCD